jgi:hypothetical protein
MTLYGMYQTLGVDVIDYPRYDAVRVNEIHPEKEAYNCWKIINGVEPDRSDLINKIKSKYFDAVLVSNWMTNFDLLQLVKDNGILTIEIDGEDVHGYTHDMKCDLKFSRECLSGWTHYLPFSAAPGMFRNIDMSKKTMDIFGMFSVTHPKRLELLNPTPWSTVQLIRNNRILHSEYLDLINESKISLAITGNGWDTLRWLEVIAAGAYLINSPRCPHPMENFPLNVQHVETRDELIKAVNEIKNWSNDQLEQAITENQQILRTYHTSEARAKYIIGVIQTCLDHTQKNIETVGPSPSQNGGLTGC